MFSHYLMFNRNCSDALAVYTKAFGAEVTEIRKYGDMLSQEFPVADGDKNLVLHSRLQCGNSELMCADSSEHCQVGTNMYVSITTKDSALVKQAWNMLQLDGEIYMELKPSFFAEMHGSLRDKFGINWMFNVLR